MLGSVSLTRFVVNDSTQKTSNEDWARCPSQFPQKRAVSKLLFGSVTRGFVPRPATASGHASRLLRTNSEMSLPTVLVRHFHQIAGRLVMCYCSTSRLARHLQHIGCN
jgi:hypothetical protein